MAEVGIRELKQNASAVVARAEAGEEITVTNRGRPVAKLVPHIHQPRRSRLEELIARGDATPATRDITDLPPPLPALPGRSLSEVLLEMREEERY
ncbi:type II toxin-antitoxin system Phd/YefM family antitoxin [Candidatus Poriferisodalis sp.]|uniref:type II toxin-antitoxin system Phd/YefM family antitoxin n=1 Tax=Candidatus Poriferisodalis sp. TaxID=3101277 RepID=UPI003B01F71C